MYLQVVLTQTAIPCSALVVKCIIIAYIKTEYGAASPKHYSTVYMYHATFLLILQDKT